MRQYTCIIDQINGLLLAILSRSDSVEKRRIVWRGWGIKKKTQVTINQQDANKMMQVKIGTTNGPQSTWISFTDRRLTAHGGMVVWSEFLQLSAFRAQLAQVLPHNPQSNHA